MKKRIFAVTLVLALGLSAFGCGKEEVETKTDDADNKAVAAYNADDYVTLGQYENIEITLEDDYQVSDEDVAETIALKVLNTKTFVKDETATEVEADSFVNVNYTGIKDGEAFEGGTATDVTLDIAKNGDVSGTSYIEGFTTGIPGHSVGETIDCDVTFPENYGNAELAGQQVIFRFDINYIAKQVTADDLTEAEIADMLGYDSYDALVEAVTKDLETTYASSYEYDVRAAVMDTIINGATVSSLPEGVVDARIDKYVASYEEQYAAYGMNFDDILAQQEMTIDDFRAQAAEMFEENLSQELIFEAVAHALKVELSDDEFNDKINELMTMNGMSSAQEVYDAYEVSSGDGERYLRMIILCNKAIDKCVETAIVK